MLLEALLCPRDFSSDKERLALNVNTCPWVFSVCVRVHVGEGEGDIAEKRITFMTRKCIQKTMRKAHSTPESQINYRELIRDYFFNYETQKKEMKNTKLVTFRKETEKTHKVSENIN